MQGHRLGLLHKNNKSLVPEATTVWVLNADNVQIAGKSYVWIDTSAWADSKKWKD